MIATELLSDELMLSPARVSRIVRTTVLVALVVTVSMALRVPQVAISAYMIFFVSQRDVATTVRTAVGGVVGVTLAIALCFVCFLVTLAEPALRLPLMVALAFGGMYLMRATPAGALALLLGFITYYGLTFADQVPSPEALVRALLWLWVGIAYPLALLVLSDLVFGARTDEVYRSGLAARLDAAAAAFAAPAERRGKAWTRLERLVRLGAGDLLPYVERAGSAATAPLRATLLRHTELLGFLLRELPDDVRHHPAAQSALQRASLACAGARDTLLQRTGAAPVPLDLLAGEQRALAELTPAARAVVLSLVRCVQTIVLGVHELASAPLAAAPPSPHEPAAPAPDTTEAVRFAVKVTLAAMSAYLLYTGLEWYSIHTATITCFFVAQDSVGATIHKLTLRLTGAVIGAALGMLAIVFVLPGLESVGGLVILVATVTLLAAWIGTASERISYSGWQIALAFYLTVLQGFSRTSKLYVGRDRIIGILVGNIIMSVVFTSLWPVRAAPAERQASSRAIAALAALLRATPADGNALDRAEADFYAQLTRARQYLRLLRFERGPRDRNWLLTLVQGLFIPVHAIARTPLPASASPAARAALSNAPQRLADWLQAFATSVASGAPVGPVPDDGVDALEPLAHDDAEPPEARARLADQAAWLGLLHAQCAALAERSSS